MAPKEVEGDNRPVPLTAEELAEALRGLPYWSGDRDGISRTVLLPPDDLDRVLPRLDRLREETGRAPRVARPRPGAAVLTVFTTSVSAVTRRDIDLAHRVDRAVDQAGGGRAG